MKIASALDDQAQSFLDKIGNADILVGIPSYNNAQTIGHVARVASEGLARHFPNLKALLMNSDGGSTDGTRDVFLKTSAPPKVSKLATQYQGMAGKGSALRAIYEACVMLGARACVVVDSDLRSITPDWIQRLAGPIMEGRAGYVTPLYLRHKYDGTITNSLAYPLTRALYGKRVRQPIGGDFGVSLKLAELYLQKDVWQTSAARFGIDIFMTTTAIAEGFDIVQANLGAKIHDAKDPAIHLAPMFIQVIGTMFALMRKYEDKWINVRSSQALPTAGPSFEQEPEPVPVTLSALVQRFKEGAKKRRPLWDKIVSKNTLSEVEALAKRDERSFGFPAEVWVKLVYEFAVAYNSESFEPDEVVDSLTPLYFGRTAGFVKETEKINTAQAEQVIEAVAELFEKEKPYLVGLRRKRST
jgi:glycosyltransferase involved in cell wall biosynthesis